MGECHMYGMVNAAIQELICSRFGEDKWDEITTKAGVEIEEFSRMSQYPDEVTYKLVGAASEALGLPADDVMQAFGEFWGLYTGQVGYGHLFAMAGNSLRDFLLNLDNLHSRVGQNFKELVPPSFTFDDISAETLRMHYHSQRAGLCPMVIGLLNGLATRFHRPLAIEHPACARNGAAHCEFLLTIQQADR
jgi:predicted hydrocarbon binding protein